MSSIDRYDVIQIRIRLLYLGMAGFFIFLAAALMREQVFNASRYRTSSERQSMRRVRISAERGRILDRNGACLADNRPSFGIAVYVEELRQPGRWNRTVKKVMEVLNAVESVTGVEKQIGEKEIYNHIRRRLPLPLIAWQDVNHKVIARLAESSKVIPGVDIIYEPVRVYPAGKYTAHVVGYVGRADISDENYHFYMPEMLGRRGIEGVYNQILAGEAGGKLLRVDASGFRYDEQREREPVSGRDIVLTLDLEIQRVLTEALGDQIGAGVVMDPRNGNIIAMVSTPSFNPNMFSPFISAKEWKSLMDDPGIPLLNRAIAGAYAPGSIFKPMVAIAALEAKVAGAATHYNCPGFFQIGNVTFRCWQRHGHGSISLQKAIEQSCNTYFCNLGMACGIDKLYSAADFTGFGHITGVDLDGEQKGLMPNDAWKRRVMRDGWRAGDTANISNGQGALLVTPIQMALFAAAIANNGYIYRPRLVARVPDQGELLRTMTWSRSTLQVIRAGMRDVIESDSGTGKRARVKGFEMAGKTGTAEYGPRENRKNHTWMTVFAPFDAPRYAIAVIVQDGESGGRTAAPVINTLMTAVFERERSSLMGKGI